MTLAFADLPQPAPSVVQLLGPLTVLQEGQVVAVPEGCKKLVAFVALQGRIVDRRFAAGSLWPDSPDDRAAGNLRSVMWRLRGAGIRLLDSDKANVFLRERTTTDVGALGAWADRLIAGSPTERDLRLAEGTPSAADLLPGWYDEWVVFERERIRQRVLHALEVLSRLLCKAERYGEAIDVAMEAIEIEPLRESAHRVLAEAHLAEGNRIEARRTYFAYRTLLMTELGVEPTWVFREWVHRRCGAGDGAAPPHR